MTQFRIAAPVALAALVACSAMPALAQVQDEVKILAGENEKPVTNAKYVPDVFDIGISGEMFFRIRADAAGFSAAERARIVDARIVYIISYEPTGPMSVRVEPVRGKPTIYVGDVRLITVYPSDVEATGAASMEQVANLWAASTACCLERLTPWSHVASE